MKKLLKRFWNDERGQVMMSLIFIIAAVVIILVSAVLAPMGVLFNTKMVEAGEDILLQANDSVSNIQNATIRNSIIASTSSALDAADNNIEVNNALFQYGWVFVLVLACIVVFIFTRRLIEYGGGSFI